MPCFAHAAALQVVAVGGSHILADRNGLTVYVFDIDTDGTSSCYNTCAGAWPAVLLPTGETVSAPLGTTTRKDGSLQVTYNGRPVYTYFGDNQEGDTNGNGLDGVWHLIAVQ